MFHSVPVTGTRFRGKLLLINHMVIMRSSMSTILSKESWEYLYPGFMLNQLISALSKAVLFFDDTSLSKIQQRVLISLKNHLIGLNIALLLLSITSLGNTIMYLRKQVVIPIIEMAVAAIVYMDEIMQARRPAIVTMETNSLISLRTI